jgi:hypothetical protein
MAFVILEISTGWHQQSPERTPKTEERLMMQQFPETYPDYKKRTYALIPFVG